MLSCWLPITEIKGNPAVYGKKKKEKIDVIHMKLPFEQFIFYMQLTA